MRLALVLDRFDPGRGGLEHWAWQWTTWLLDRGHEVDVVAAEAAAETIRPGLRLHPLGEPAGRDGSRYAFAERVAGYLSQVDADVVHDLGVGWRCDILQPQFGTRLADDRRAIASLSPGRRFGARLSWQRRKRLADICRLERRQYAADGPRVVAVSRMTSADLRSAHGIPAGRIEVIHNGVDVSRFAPACDAERSAARRRFGVDGFVLVFVGHNFRLKGLDTVLRAVSRLGTSNVQLLVVGRGPLESYRRKAGRLGITGRVTFAGGLPDARVAYAAADAFVQPTFYDPCSLTVLEAAASGLPVLTTRFNGASEFFDHGRSAWILDDSADDRAAADAIISWLDPHVRLDMAEAGRVAAGTATHDRCFARLLATCHRIIERRRAA